MVHWIETSRHEQFLKYEGVSFLQHYFAVDILHRKIGVGHLSLKRNMKRQALLHC